MLYLIPTPIGNLEDITFRALRILKESNLILVEDTRISKKLLNHYNICRPLKIYHMHNEHKIIPYLLNKIKNQEIISLISDSGTPSISDPGFLLIRACIKANFKIECLPGPTAFVPALVISGLPINEFVFLGFLPKKKKRKKKLLELSKEQRTIVLYESPHKLLTTLNDIQEYFGIRNIVVCREISKKFEQIIRGSSQDIKNFFIKTPPKGEIVLIIKGYENKYYNDKKKILVRTTKNKKK